MHFAFNVFRWLNQNLTPGSKASLNSCAEIYFYFHLWNYHFINVPGIFALNIAWTTTMKQRTYRGSRFRWLILAFANVSAIYFFGCTPAILFYLFVKIKMYGFWFEYCCLKMAKKTVQKRVLCTYRINACAIISI